MTQSEFSRDVDRRNFLRMTGAAAVGGGVAAAMGHSTLLAATNRPLAKPRAREFTLPELPYGFDALEPVIDQQTMTIHHGKHHQGYVDKLNAAVKDHPDLAAMPVDDLVAKLNEVPESIRTAVCNNGGGHANHSLFWSIMRAPRENNAPEGAVADAIEKTFGSFAGFQEKFAAAAAGQFGSGWAWLVLDGDKLAVTATPNQDSPLTEGKKPILGIDVWEHAYYLHYQNRRADYVTAWWKVVNWDEVATRMASAGRG